MKRVLLRNIPELTPELQAVINAFDPWARDRGQYYASRGSPARAQNPTTHSRHSSSFQDSLSKRARV